MSMSGGSTDMTLAFELSALKRLAKPGTAFADARQWTEYVGVVSDEPTYVVTNFTRKRRIRQDFFSGPKDKRESLENVKSQFETDRHVFVGADEADEALAEETGWEFLHVEDAAEAAGWELGDPEDEEAASGEPERDDWP
ncbi:3-deoxy-D-manno-octulosonate 8-phosphate phosphatase KdsC-like HAD superfamily phosphatase [Halarchaeum rubridurum]|uniref:3-deoxy-D-manno-octulosonate 8-phosphate phosphatase KdsC-like HAD superfamily phosphatase n=2 Tax=Halarchaeum rubridurum TaxID=489911 RepID=A0A830FXM1_9EURY|nr:3-deoxy-D-manno-octulosonate 8-phosphate phosphatase KdsC-like HAD superfamily phosphatase [Halarchaeum rubridurum]GGM55000.1 hypothetical protein GCM10009017_01600 [Halarchaeum rubridurum]